ncbi:DUF1045 domain-containing protein [Falsigemmobacter faecalis]|uniref:DUF1045 domain-containing protein n=1 Tax=Falsigemmobacter faecalis TaxID=2488730 RepID=A0A3P3DRR0_9RHOB|nr:DUF1045 domain-containing protein [Falsigemmobacter faecalis]RRH76634.1 DUF1045 domain-containing protein [Falsigemmobacter faecalis]
MGGMKRYAVYYAPPPGAFASRAARWLGRDVEAGRALPHPEAGFDVAALTGEPRRYGFHATLKPPFRLAGGQEVAGLHQALQDLAAELAPVTLAGLSLAQIGRFLALIPEGDTAALEGVAGEIVTRLEPFRAALTAAETARRRPETLSPRQRELLGQYGYPYVLEEFRFHMTLTDGTPRAAEAVPFLREWFAPVLPRPFEIAEICLFAEPQEGPFELLHRYPLTGSRAARKR